MKLAKENTISLFIDYQEKIVPAMNNASPLIEHTARLLSGLAVYDVPVVLTRQYPKGLGDVIPEIKNAARNAVLFDKTTFSCLGSDEIRNYFSQDSRVNILLAGIETHICVLQTALDLLDMGKKVYIATDCVSSRCPKETEIALKRMYMNGVIPTTGESALFEITQKAGSPEFKAISKLVTNR